MTLRIKQSINSELKEERKQLINGIFFPVLFVAILWIIHFALYVFSIDPSTFGLFPRSFTHFYGIFTFHLVHDNQSLGHIFSNSVPLVVLGSIIFYFYRGIAFQVFFWVYIMTGVWLWAAAETGTCTIGASGLVYGFVSFLFFSGIFRWDRRLLILSLLVIFLYGSIIWGMFPLLPDQNISWQGHLLGFISGTITAYFYRHEGPKRIEHKWEDEDDESNLPYNEISENENPNDVKINYEFRKKDDEEKK